MTMEFNAVEVPNTHYSALSNFGNWAPEGRGRLPFLAQQLTPRKCLDEKPKSSASTPADCFVHTKSAYDTGHSTST